MALAASQMETGRLLPDVRDRALAIIDAGGDVELWRGLGDASLARRRAQVLERLAAKLRGPQPKPKRGRESLAPGEVYPIVAPLAWEGRRVPKRGRISCLPFVPDPVSPDKPLLILVSTFSKKHVFGPDLGEVVAHGVDIGLRAEAGDVGHHTDWRVVAASGQEALLLARYRAEEDR
jgi:hypothetical protein